MSPLPRDFDLDDDARAVLDRALSAAAALGDRECGTAYVLHALFAPPLGELAEVAELFVLDALRIERAIQKLREPFQSGVYDGDPPLSERVRIACTTKPYSGDGATGVFELLFGILADDDSTAADVLRELGVRPAEVRRLAAYGTRHLSREEAAALLDALDRRKDADRCPWWGPSPDGVLTPVTLDGGRLELARSASTVASLGAVAVGRTGLKLTLTVESLRPWLLPPAFEPPDFLVAPRSTVQRLAPEFFRFEVVSSDGSRANNLLPVDRWTAEPPAGRVLVALETRTHITTPNDRRAVERRVVEVDWWLWPLPTEGTLELRCVWPAEVLSGLAVLDTRPFLPVSPTSRQVTP